MTNARTVVTLGTATPGGGAFLSAESNRQWSVMGRLGYLPVPSTLIYAAGGFAQLNVHATANLALAGGGTAFTSRGRTSMIASTHFWMKFFLMRRKPLLGWWYKHTRSL